MFEGMYFVEAAESSWTTLRIDFDSVEKILPIVYSFENGYAQATIEENDGGFLSVKFEGFADTVGVRTMLRDKLIMTVISRVAKEQHPQFDWTQMEVEAI